MAEIDSSKLVDLADLKVAFDNAGSPIETLIVNASEEDLNTAQSMFYVNNVDDAEKIYNFIVKDNDYDLIFLLAISKETSEFSMKPDRLLRDIQFLNKLDFHYMNSLSGYVDVAFDMASISMSFNKSGSFNRSNFTSWNIQFPDPGYRKALKFVKIKIA